MGKTVDPSICGLKLDIKEFLVVDVLGVGAPVLGVERCLETPFGYFHGGGVTRKQ